MNVNPGSKPPPVSSLVIFLTGLALIATYYELRQGRISNNDLIYFALLIPSVILHEISHGFLAHIWGDETAKNAGRLTLNPLRHIDPLGTLIIPGALILLGQGLAFAYAKPVPVNVSGMSRNKAMMVGLIGPITNIAIAVLVALVFNIVDPRGMPEWLINALFQLGIVNVVLATFNLIPVPPLDGAAIIERFLPAQYMRAYYTFRQYAMFILLFLVLSSRSSLLQLFLPALRLWAHLLPSGFVLG